MAFFGLKTVSKQSKPQTALQAPRSTVTTIAVSSRLPAAEPAVQVPANLVHGLSEALHAHADEMREIAKVIARYEPLTLEAQRLYVGDVLQTGGQFSEAWRKLARYLSGVSE